MLAVIATSLCCGVLHLRLGHSPEAEPACLPRPLALTALRSPEFSPPSRFYHTAPSRAPDLRLQDFLRAGLFFEALELAENTSIDNAETRRDRVTAALVSWVRARPADAPILADYLRSHDTTPSAFPVFVRAWAQVAPAALANHALALPPDGHDRAIALTAALDRWILNDPAGASDWIIHLSDPSEFDQAASLLVGRTDTLHRSTATALSWAENLADPALRLRALTHVLREWAERDPVAARRYPATTPSLTADERAALLATFAPRFS